MTSGQVTCAGHGQPVTLGGGPVICHQDGSYCRSQEFTAGTLDRGQAMALLILAAGLDILGGTSGEVRSP